MTAYFRPKSLDDALGFLAGQPRATVAAGCTDLFAATGARELDGPVLDITAIDALGRIGTGSARLRIGAAVTWSRIVAADLPAAFDMLKEAAREVGSVQIQNTGTIGGNICNASPAADGVPCLLALDAEVELRSATGRRVMPLQEFVTGPRRTALAPGELMTAVLIPAEAARGQSVFLKLGARRYLVISIAMVAVRLLADAGRIARAAVAVGACGPVATRLGAVEEALVGADLSAPLGERLSEAALQGALAPISDMRGDAAYRREAAAELVRRALGAAALRVTEAVA